LADSDKSKLAFGIAGDYDIGVSGNGYSNNETEYFADADFSNGEIVCATQIAFNEEEEIYFGISAFSNEIDSVPQAAGLVSDDVFSIPPPIIVNALTKGKATQVPATTDIGFASGINFTNGLKGSSKECSFCLAMAESKEELKENLRDCVLGTKTNVIGKNKAKSLSFKNNNLIFNDLEEGSYNLVVTNIEGKIAYELNNISIKNGSELKIDIKNGFYFLSLYNNSKNYYFKFIVLN